MHAPTPLTIAGAGVYLPRERRASAELDRRFGQAEGWTETQFGIRSRGVAADDETTSFMAARAAEAALAQAGWAATDINALIGACGVMEQPIPGVSILVQERLGLGRSGVWAFDVNQTCLSFLTALDVVAMGFSTGRFRRALVVSSDIASAGLDWSNPASSAIFGDGAAAFCFEAADDPGRKARDVGLVDARAHARGDAAGVDDVLHPDRDAVERKVREDSSGALLGVGHRARGVDPLPGLDAGFELVDAGRA